MREKGREAVNQRLSEPSQDVCLEWQTVDPVSRARSSSVPGVVAYFRPGYAAG